MPSKKPRLYIALYARGGSRKPLEDTYHWTLLVGPKTEEDGHRGTKFHAKNIIIEGGTHQWVFEELDVPLTATNMLLVRIAIAKINDVDRLRHILRAVPIRQGTSGWNCVGWVREALESLRADGEALGTHVIEWEKVRDAALSYCRAKKAAHRFDGKGGFDIERPPTLDLMKNEEIIP